MCRINIKCLGGLIVLSSSLLDKLKALLRVMKINFYLGIIPLSVL